MALRAFSIADTAKLQIAQLPETERRALRMFFRTKASKDSKTTEGGFRVGRVGTRNVLWRQDIKGQPVVLSVMDASFAPEA